jgi:hypothetical protein
MGLRGSVGALRRRCKRRAWPAAAAIVLVSIAACSGRPAPSGTPSPSSSASAPGPRGVRSGFIAFGDFGTGTSAQRAVAKAMAGWAAAGHRVDALVTTGDNVYPDGNPQLYTSRLDQPYQALRKTRPMWGTLGNHDVINGHGPAELRHLGLPKLPYVKQLPGAELLFLDANRPDAAQARWLDSHLSDPGPPVQVVVFHQPAWSCSLHGSTPDVDRQWVPVLERHRAELVLNGHDHNYQRFTSPHGVTYVVTGGGGASPYPLENGCRTPHRDAAASQNHFTAVEINAKSVTITAVSTSGKVLDRTVVPGR